MVSFTSTDSPEGMSCAFSSPSRIIVGDTSLRPVIQTLQGFSEACSAVSRADHSALTQLLQPGVML